MSKQEESSMIDRPDLSGLPPQVVAYIEHLEAELRDKPRKETTRPAIELEMLPLVPSEPPTTVNIISLTAQGTLKRTTRHLYQRQRRGGMGIFDLDIPENEPLAVLTAADETQSILLFTDQARAFRLPLSQILSQPVRGKGQSIALKLGLQPDEQLVAALPDQARGAVALASERGMVRYLRHHVFGEYMKPGTVLFNPKLFGRLVAACRTPGDGDLFIATRRGKAIRFSEKLVPPQGGPGMRLDEGDNVVAIAAVDDESSVFLVDEQGDGTIRLMTAFNPNKSAGGGGKIAMHTDSLVSAVTIEEKADIFIISRLGKIIRFLAEEVPAKEGVVQGVHCMMLRSDQVVSATVS
jgi:DNA gyrase subunit A